MLIRSGMGMQLSGSVGGVVAARNAGGAYLRNRTVPVNPNSVRQQAARAAFSLFAIGWRNLTQAQRDGWIAYAVETPVLNRLGESINVSGSAQYLRTNSFRAAAGVFALTDAPITPGLSTLGTFTSITVAAAGTATVVLAGATADFGGTLQIGPPVSAGVNFFKGPFSLAARPVYSATGFADVSINVAGFRYGPMIESQRRFARVASADSTGRLSNSIIVPFVVTA